MTAQTSKELNEPIEIAPDIYWVGLSRNQDFEANTYLRVFKGNGKQLNLLIDPGPPSYFNEISLNLEKVLGKNYKLDLAYINHQDPDVCGATILFQRHFPNMYVITSEDTWRLIRFYGLKASQFIATDKFKQGRINLKKTGHKLAIIPTPYVHFRGAVALYDMEHKVLFSGDMFGGLSPSQDIYADKEYWQGMKTFHEIYMPSSSALKEAVGLIREENREIKIIASQHGHVIREDLVDFFMDKLASLPVGTDIRNASRLIIENHVQAFRQILEQTDQKISPEVRKSIINTFHSTGEFPSAIVIKKNDIYDLKLSPEESLNLFITELYNSTETKQHEELRKIIVNILSEWNIEPPEEGKDTARDATPDDIRAEVNDLLSDIFD